MLLIILACSFVILLLAFISVYFAPKYETNFSLCKKTDEQKLALAVRELAKNCAVVENCGRGVPYKCVTTALNNAYNQLTKRVKSNAKLEEYERIIYDDYYKIQENLSLVKKDKNAFLSLFHVGGKPRIYLLCSLIVRSLDGNVSGNVFSRLVSVFNTERPLTYPEILYLPSMLRFCLCEYLSLFCARSTNANFYKNKGIEDGKKNRFNRALTGYASYLMGISETSEGKNKKFVERTCENNGISLFDRIANYQAFNSVYLVSVSSTVCSMHGLVKWLTPSTMLDFSPVHDLLKEDKTYLSSTDYSKYCYLNRVHELAKRTCLSEREFCRRMIARAQNEKCDFCKILFPHQKSKHIERLYIFIQVLLAFFLTGASVFAFNLWWSVPIQFPVFLWISIRIVNLVCSRFARRPHLYVSEKALSESTTATIVYSRLIASESEVEDAVFMLKSIACANPSTRFSYALLVDFPSSDSQISPYDQPLIDKLKAQFSTLDDRFCLLLRDRTYNEQKKIYDAHEKKRGALLDFNEYVLYGKTDAFRLILGERKKSKYAIVLDADTALSSAIDLVCEMEHPYNGEVSVMNLNMRATPKSANATYFSALTAGEIGLNGYINENSSVENDLFFAGNFTGKGIYHIEKMHDSVNVAFPDNAILSHDYIEGAYAGCATSGESALDECPPNFSAYFTRALRWLRGDWQLLPWLKNKVKNKQGRKVKNVLRPVQKWHIFCNMLYSLLPVFYFTLVTLSCVIKADYLVILALVGAFLGEIFSLPSLFYAPRIFLKNCAIDLFLLSVLPVSALYNGYNILLTLVRLIKKRNLLEWKVYAHSKGKKDFTLLLFSTTIVLFLLNLFLAQSFLVGALCVLFVLGAPLIKLTDEGKKEKQIPSVLQGYLMQIARSTWHFFEESVTAKTHFLPPDNYDERDGYGYAMRTSPTDIAMALNSVFCAYTLEIISLEKAQNFIKKTVKTLINLPKWQGNLYNWYDLNTLEVMSPRYVSFVDEGNFLCALMLVKSIADEQTAREIENLIAETKIEKLFDNERNLFFVGYNEREHSYDCHYDLCASEASIGYLVAIALGKITSSSWYTLSRRMVKSSGGNAMYSWTGGAFEYLLTPAFFGYEKGTLFYQSALSCVKAQINYSKRKKQIVWGISESQYRSYEDNGDYKYRAHGLSELALSKRYDCAVFAPYASLLSLRYAPSAVFSNLCYFMEKGTGKYGLYEAYDDKPVKTYMAHHQGMIMLAVCNFLKDNAVVNQLSKEFCVHSVQPLLSLPACFEEVEKAQSKIFDTPKSEQKRVNKPYAYPTLSLNFSGAYSFVTDERGRGFSHYHGHLLTRKRQGTGMLVFAKLGKSEYDLTGKTDATFYGGKTQYNFSCKQFSASVFAMALTGIEGEVRQVSIKNTSDKEIEITLSSYCEIVLDYEENDRAHREYNSMFVKTKEINYPHAVVATRPDAPFFAHTVVGGKAVFETNRANFFNRHKNPSFGAVLDPIFSASVTLKIKAGEQKQVNFVYFASFSKSKLLKSLITVSQENYFDKYALLGSYAPLNAQASKLASLILSNVGSYKENLSYAFPTCYPLVAVKFLSSDRYYAFEKTINDLSVVARAGIKFNLAILYCEKSGYFHSDFDLIDEIIERSSIRKNMIRSGALRVINFAGQKDLYLAVERNCVDLQRENIEIKTLPEIFSPVGASEKLDAPELILPLGRGGFTNDYAYYLDVSDRPAPKPWSNIIANENFGTLITDSGGGYTYAHNSRENKITEWSNDSVLDGSSESIFLGENNCVWSLTRNPSTKNASYAVKHAIGYTSHYCNYNGVCATLTQTIGSAHVKYYIVKLKNTNRAVRKIDVTFCADLVLGDFKENTIHSFLFGREGNRLTAKNCQNGMSVFVDCSENLIEYAFSRKTMKNRSGRYCKINKLDSAVLGNSLIYCTTISLAPDQEKEVVFALCEEGEPCFDCVNEILEKNIKRSTTLSPVLINSGNLALDILYRWLPVQILDCRFLARTAFYQAGGAYGFRDQLQDGMSVTYFDKKLAREHILRSAAHQYESGDVQHWWHPPFTGVRTHFCDDRLFLVWATVEYIRYTGDREILSEKVPFLRDIPIKPDQKSVYHTAQKTEENYSLYEHIVRAIDSTAICDGLVLMKGGDWNDAMDEVGKEGKGKSIFATMLLYLCIKKILPYASEKERNRWVQIMSEISSAVENAWDGEWFIRAITDGGKVLGSKQSDVCKIDLLTQAFSAISEIVESDKIKTALYSAQKLIDEKSGIIKLFAPPFTSEQKNIGYITRYPEGVRENGGQYTHAAVWYAIALFTVGEKEKACKVVEMLNPINHARDEESVNRYKVEPYVMSADIYSGERAGEGGWTWYTGSASWTYKCITEYMMGVNIEGDKLTLAPNLSSDYKEVTLTINQGDCHAKITIDNESKGKKWQFVVDGVGYNVNFLRLSPSLNGREIKLRRTD